ncbi:FtsX-like permease family protein [Streptomyces thinghirensis]|nr:FtsX-like permease family protein [Streptomyces thinghirensis]
MMFCFIAILNTLLMATADRRRDLAVLRTAGATPRQVLRFFVAESLLVSAIGVVLALAATAVNLAGLWGALFQLFGTTPDSRSVRGRRGRRGGLHPAGAARHRPAGRRGAAGPRRAADRSPRSRTPGTCRYPPRYAPHHPGPHGPVPNPVGTGPCAVFPRLGPFRPPGQKRADKSPGIGRRRTLGEHPTTEGTPSWLTSRPTTAPTGSS